MTKKFVFQFSLVGGGVFIVLLLALLYNFCGPYRSACKEVYSVVVYFFFPLPFVFLLSLITYKLPEQVFQAWWKVAVWFVPFLIGLTFLIEWMPKNGGGWAGLYSELPYQFLGFFYVVFILVSLIKIFFAWRRVKGSSQ